MVSVATRSLPFVHVVMTMLTVCYKCSPTFWGRRKEWPLSVVHRTASPRALGTFLFIGSVGLGPALTLAVVRFAWVAAEREYMWWDCVGSV